MNASFSLRHVGFDDKFSPLSLEPAKDERDIGNFLTEYKEGCLSCNYYVILQMYKCTMNE